MQSFVDASGLPFATMIMDKSVLEEQQAACLGTYDGGLVDNAVRGFVESCDWVLTVGTMMTDFNTGEFTARLDPAKTIDICHHRTRVGAKVYPNVEMADILAGSLAVSVSVVKGRRFGPPRWGQRREAAMTRLRSTHFILAGKSS